MRSLQEKNYARKTASLFRALGQPARIRILLAIGQGEACVCHLEAVLGMRQAYISQHLMALRDIGLVTTRREGRYIFYRLQNPSLLNLIVEAAQVSGVAIPEKAITAKKDDCGCPSCSKSEVEMLTVLGGSSV
jgi:DNA-binding transcriptional ArsR family regulator